MGLFDGLIGGLTSGLAQWQSNKDTNKWRQDMLRYAQENPGGGGGGSSSTSTSRGPGTYGPGSTSAGLQMPVGQGGLEQILAQYMMGGGGGAPRF